MKLSSFYVVDVSSVVFYLSFAGFLLYLICFSGTEHPHTYFLVFFFGSKCWRSNWLLLSICSTTEHTHTESTHILSNYHRHTYGYFLWWFWSCRDPANYYSLIFFLSSIPLVILFKYWINLEFLFYKIRQPSYYNMNRSSFLCKQLWLIILVHKCVYFSRRSVSRLLQLVTTWSSLLWRNESEHQAGWVCMSQFVSPKQGNCLTSLRISFLTWTWGTYHLITGACSDVPRRQCRQR